ncbi:transposase family protein [Streptomyces anandii]|uniref:transposase family protein n=1 Tax=Streptomyces anandii TaxID=285454 RepID=UPI0037AA25E8
MFVCLSSVGLSSRVLRFLTGRLTAWGQEVGRWWRRFPVGCQALFVLAFLRCGDAYVQLAAGFGVGIATVYRCICEAVGVLAVLAPSLGEVMTVIRVKALVILDGTLLPVDRVAADTPVLLRDR